MRRRLIDLAWPVYACENCIGQEIGTGCWCGHHGASGPGVGPEPWRVLLRKVLLRTGIAPQFYA